MIGWALFAVGAALVEPTVLECGAAERTIAVPAAGVELRAGAVPTGSVLVLTEQGRSVTLDTRAEVASVDVPPRLATHRVALSGASIRLVSPAGPTQVTARVQCEPTRAASGWGWSQSAARLAARIRGGIGSLDDPSLEAELQALERRAEDPEDQALALHLRAQLQLLAGRAERAAEAFAAAERAWRRLGRERHARAARAARLEDLLRIADYGRVLEETAAEPDADDPYALRIRRSRCLAQRYTGAIDAAGACFRWLIARLERHDEALERAVTMLDLATIELDRARPEAALESIEAAIALIDAHPEAEDERGRAHYHLAAVRILQGRPTEAFAALETALGAFRRSGSERWLGNTLLRIANTLSEFELFVDAEARQYFVQIDAPTRQAVADLIEARLRLRAGRAAEALALAEQAEQRFAAWSMPLEQELAYEVILRAALGSKARARADAAADWLLRSGSARNGTLLALLEWRLDVGDWEDARRRLDRLRARPLNLSELTRLQIGEARLAEQRRGTEHALALLAGAARTWDRMARTPQSPVLRERIAHFGQQLRAEAIDLIAARVHRGEALGGRRALAAWLPPAVHAGPRPAASPDTRELEQRLAAAAFPAVLPHGQPELRWDALLQHFGGSETADPNADDDPIVIDPRPTAGDELWLLRGRRWLIVHRTDPRGDSTLVHADPDRIEARAQQLEALLARPDGALDAIASLAAELRARLLDPRPVEELAVVQGGLPIGIPWGVLLDVGGPEGPQALSIRWLTGHGPRSSTPAAITVLSSGLDPASGLPALDFARGETDRIRRSLGPQPIDVREVRSPNRQQLIESLQDPGAWMHFAGHGSLAPGRVAGAGLWLAQPRRVPEFFGGLELIAAGVQSPVVVLGACELAGGHDDPGAVSDFARTLIHAGAGEVVASRWPLSDSASAHWVRAFYRAIAVDRATPSRALVRAQRDLRATRAFRHPYYWAGLTLYSAWPAPVR